MFKFQKINKLKLEIFYKQIGLNVKKYRTQKHMSQLELSIRIGHKSISFLSNCENYKNKIHFNLEHLFLIANALDIDICKLTEFHN